MLVKSDHLPKVRGENEKYLSCHHPEQLFLVKKSVFPGGIRLPTTKREEVLLGPLKPYYPKDQTSGGIWKTRGGEIYAIAWNKLYGSGTSFSKNHRLFGNFTRILIWMKFTGIFGAPENFPVEIDFPAELWKTNLQKQPKGLRSYIIPKKHKKTTIKHRTSTGFFMKSPEV